MKLALLMSNGETVALASRLIAVGASACTVKLGSPLPASDWLMFDESIPLASLQDRADTRALIRDALVSGKPVFAFLSPSAPASPKCALVMSEMLAYSSAAAVTPFGAASILGLEGEYEGDAQIAAAFGDDEGSSQMAALAKELLETHELSFTLVFDPEGERGVLYTGDAFEEITAQSMENAVAELFRSVD